jgi:fucose permease
MRGDRLLSISFGCFVGLGMADASLGAAWPHIRSTFGVRLDALGLLLVLSTIGFAASGLAMGRLTRRFGSAVLIGAGVGGMSIALLLIAVSPAWSAIMLASLLLGLAAAPVDAGLQTLTALRRGVRAMSLLHASYGLGAVLGPLLLTGLLVLTLSWRVDYMSLAALQALLLLVVWLGRRYWPRDPSRDSSSEPAEVAAPRPPAATTLLVVGLFFTNVGLEISAGQWAASFFEGARAVAVGLTGILVACFWGGLAVGRLVAGVVGHRFSPSRLLDMSLVTTALGVLAFWLTSEVAIEAAGLVMMGFGLASIYPVLMQLTPARTGAAGTAGAIGYQAAAGAVGSAVVPGAVGLALQQWGLALLGPLLAGLAAVLILLRLLAAGRLAGARAPAAPVGASE